MAVRVGGLHGMGAAVPLANLTVAIALRLAAVSAAVAAATYAVARAAGLSDLGRRVDLAERSGRRGEGGPGLANARRRDAEDDWD